MMTKRIKARSLIIGGFFTLFFISLMIKLYWVQVVDAAWLLEKAEKNWEENQVLQPKRGAVLDRHGKILAQDAEAFTVAVSPQLIYDHHLEKKVVDGLAPILNMDSPDGKDKLYSLVTKKRKDGTFQPQVEIRNEGWKIDSETAKKIRDFKEKHHISGIYLLEEQKRYYPANSLAAHIIGYTNKEGKAITGTELWHDDILQGKPGSISYEQDRLGYELPDAKVTYKPAVDGQTVRLTIDENIQHYTEEALKGMFDQFKPKSAMAVAVDPKTMEILAMANLPDYNPNKYWSFASQSDFLNRSVSSQYEPGSTFKIVTLAGAVQEGIFHPNDTYTSGQIRIGGTTLHDHNGVGWGKITYLEGLKRSSNVAFVKLGYEGLGEEKLRKYIDKFGFGQPTGIDLPGEIGGVINFHYPSEIATATYGQGKVSVTAIQQVAAVSAIANGGKLMVPHVLKEIIDPNTNQVVKKIEPKVVRQVITEDTARKTAEYLEQVVSDQQIGTGRGAYLEGYRVAGKTGTANVVVNGQYAPDKWVVSFIGFAPVEDPRVVICVIVDEPDLGGDYHRGGEVAAPVFREIMEKSLRYLGVPSSLQSGSKVLKQEKLSKVPNLQGETSVRAADQLKRKAIKYEVMGNGRKIVKQIPEPGTQISSGQRMYLLTDKIDNMAFPDLKGKSTRDVYEICAMLQVRCSVQGEGYVDSQTVTGSAGSKLVKLRMKPLAVEDSSAE